MAIEPPAGWHERLARRAEQNAAFMASALAAFRRLQRLDDRALAAFLRCPPEMLPHLALCRRPRPASPRFQADVTQIAAYVRADPDQLVRLLRRVDVAAAFSADTAAEHLAAARDREEDTATEGEQPTE
ncbi:MAG: hypothetical protein C4290_12020 [Chloroflexota bacterium]